MTKSGCRASGDRVAERIAEWVAAGFTPHHIVRRAHDDGGWDWGTHADADALDVAALKLWLERDPTPLRGREPLLHEIVEQYSSVDRDHGNAGELSLDALFDACIARHADVDAIDADGKTALFYANLHAAERLIGAGANVNVRTSIGATLLMHGVQRTHMVELLLRHGAATDVRDASGQTARDWARYYDAEETLRLLDG